LLRRGKLWLNARVNKSTPSLSQSVRLRLADDVTFQSLGPGEETVMLSLNSGYLYTCNETTAAFLRGLDGRQSLAAVIDMLFNEFQVPRETLSRDMTALAAKLLDEKLLVEEP
jgi:pyrroloquinoline quinone biosynthesis protein D